MPRESQIAASTSEEASLRPRSISDRYGIETFAARATSARVRAEMDEILSQHTGHPVSKIRSDTDRNMTLSAREAVAYGLADHVITTRKDALAELPAAS